MALGSVSDLATKVPQASQFGQKTKMKKETEVQGGGVSALVTAVGQEVVEPSLTPQPARDPFQERQVGASGLPSGGPGQRALEAGGGRPSIPSSLPVHIGTVSATGEVAQGAWHAERRPRAHVRPSEHRQPHAPTLAGRGLLVVGWAEVTSQG